MQLIDGKSISLLIKEEIKKEINLLGFKPTLTIIQVGENISSDIYVRNKIKLASDLNCETKLLKFNENITEEQLINEIKKLNNDVHTNGILVQLPIPKHINEQKIIESISPNKDVDCFCWKNIGKLWTCRYSDAVLKSCTPMAVIELIKRSNIQIAGKHVVIIGRSNIVGKPLAALFLLENATVTICHSKTENIKKITQQADIVVAAIGKAKYFNGEYFNNNVVVIDVGINRDPITKKVCGDVDFESVKEKVAAITPVPGGVGPMTVMMVMKNLISLVKIQKGIK